MIHHHMGAAMRRFLLGIAIGLTMVTWSSPVVAWGDRGHSIVAEIAQRHLTPKAADAVRGLLDGASMAGVASWADDFKFQPAGAATKPWHFVNIDNDKAGYTESDCKGACLVSALRDQAAILADKNRNQNDRHQALLMLIHLVGDSTQPFHCDDRKGDEGANNVTVYFEAIGPDGKALPLVQSNLHAVWDDGLVNARAFSWGVYAGELDAKVVPTQTPASADGDFAPAWATECHKVAQRLYELTPIPTPDPQAPIAIGPSYQQAVKATLDEQLATGGLRLAALLNRIVGQ